MSELFRCIVNVDHLHIDLGVSIKEIELGVFGFIEECKFMLEKEKYVEEHFLLVTTKELWIMPLLP